MLDADNADFTPRTIGIVTNRHSFGMPASLCAAVAKPQDDKPAKVSILIEAAADETFFVLTLEAWNEMQRQLDAKVKEWAHTDQPAPFPPGDYADSAERKHLVAQLAYFTEISNQMQVELRALNHRYAVAEESRKSLVDQVEKLRKWQSEVRTMILAGMLSD